MRLLLDTHTFLWFVNDSPRLSAPAKTLLESEADLLLSDASLWEIAIKISIGKLALAEPYETFMPRQLESNDIEVLPLGLSHFAVVSRLPFHHRDPFDRLLVAQATVEGLAVVSADAIFDAYSIRRLW